MSQPHRFVALGALAWLLAGAATFAAPAADHAPRQEPGATAKPAPEHPRRAAATAPNRARSAAATRAAEGRVSAEAESLLQGVTAAYRGFSSYDIEGHSYMVMSLAGVEQRADVPFRLAGAKPARVRSEIMNPSMSYVNISDGSKTWIYLPQLQQYTETDAAPLTSAGGSAGEIGNAMAAGTPIQRYLSARQGLLAARVLGEAAVEVGGNSVNCAVVEAQYATPDSARLELSPNRFWIDRARRLVLRDSLQVKVAGGPNGVPVTMSTVTTFSKLDIGQALPDTIFTFHPPAGAVKVDQFTQPGVAEPVSPLVGKPAEDFTLSDLSGRKQRLSALKGKVVLLDFWATWCGPCRRELPTIVKLHKELAPKGLAVVAVNVGEPDVTVDRFLKRNQITLPVWLDLTAEVSSKYGASSIPTLVVIDRKGNVTAHKIGMRDEATLRALVAEAGLK